MKNTNFGIVKTFNEDDFINEFKAYNREDNFSLEGLRILFESLEQTAIDCEMNMEIDVIALCCEYNEDSLVNIINLYNIDVTDCDEDEKIEVVEDYLLYNTVFCGSYEDDDGVTHFIYQAF